jgi:hypothetical protein
VRGVRTGIRRSEDCVWHYARRCAPYREHGDPRYCRKTSD